MPGFSWKASLDVQQPIQGINQIASSATSAINSLNAMAGKTANFSAPTSSLNAIAGSMNNIASSSKKLQEVDIGGSIGGFAKTFVRLSEVEGGLKFVAAGLSLWKGNLADFDSKMRSLPIGIGPVYGAISDIADSLTGWKKSVKEFDDLIANMPEIKIQAKINLEGMDKEIKKLEGEKELGRVPEGALKELAKTKQQMQQEIDSANETFKKNTEKQYKQVEDMDKKMASGIMGVSRFEKMRNNRENVNVYLLEQEEMLQKQLVNVKEKWAEEIRKKEIDLEGETTTRIRKSEEKQLKIKESLDKLNLEAKKKVYDEEDYINETRSKNLKNSGDKLRAAQFEAEVNYKKALRTAITEEDRKAALDRRNADRDAAYKEMQDDKKKEMDNLKLTQGKWFEFAKQIKDVKKAAEDGVVKQKDIPKEFATEENIFISPEGKWRTLKQDGTFKEVPAAFKQKFVRDEMNKNTGRSVRSDFTGKFITEENMRPVTAEEAVRKTLQDSIKILGESANAGNKLLEQIAINTAKQFEASYS